MYRFELIERHGAPDEYVLIGERPPTWREKQIIWERIRSIYESDKLELGRDYDTSDMLRTYRGWLRENAGRSEAERAEDLSS